MNAYIIIGTRQNVSQDEIGGPFVPHPEKEVVIGFFNIKDAENYIIKNKLEKPRKSSYSDTSYYNGGYYDMDIVETDIQ